MFPETCANLENLKDFDKKQPQIAKWVSIVFETYLNKFLVKKHTYIICHTQVDYIYPLVEVGIVSVVVVHGRVLEAFDNLGTYLNEFPFKNTYRTCATL